MLPSLISPVAEQHKWYTLTKADESEQLNATVLELRKLIGAGNATHLDLTNRKVAMLLGPPADIEDDDQAYWYGRLTVTVSPEKKRKKGRKPTVPSWTERPVSMETLVSPGWLDPCEVNLSCTPIHSPPNPKPHNVDGEGQGAAAEQGRGAPADAD